MSARQDRGCGRGQTDVVGVVILSAFVVVSAGTFGTVYLASSRRRRRSRRRSTWTRSTTAGPRR